MKVLVTQPIHEKGMKLLEEAGHEVVVAPDASAETLATLIDDKVDGIIVRYNVLNRAHIEKAPNLKVISRHGIGVELIDLEAATEHGVIVTNTPDATTVSVAEHVVMMVMALAKKLMIADTALRKGNYYIKDKYMPDDVDGKTIGLVGLGRIGREVARRCQGIGMKIIAFDPYMDSAVAQKLGVTMVDSLEKLLAVSDFVSLHTPLTPETRGMFGEKQFSMMKPDAYFINCARGEVVDEAALIKALQEKKIAGAGLDVFAQEPPSPDNPLFSFDNVIVTPHSAALTLSGKVKMATGAAEQLLKVLRGEKPDYVVNPKVMEKLNK